MRCQSPLRSAVGAEHLLGAAVGLGLEGVLRMSEPIVWKCECCGGWFDFRTVVDTEQLVPIAGMECSCPNPNIQQRFVLEETLVQQEISPLDVIDRITRACQATAEEVSRIRAGSWTNPPSRQSASAR
jgi:hypothetical protein